MAKEIVTIKTYRTGNGTPYYDTFEVPVSDGMTAQAALRYIYQQLDPTLAFRDYNCFLGVCTCCMVKVNGKPVRSCMTPVEPGSEVVIDPPHGKSIRDLVTDFGLRKNPYPREEKES